MTPPCDMCDVHTVPVDEHEAWVLDFHRVVHFGLKKVRQAVLGLSDPALGLMQFMDTTFTDTPKDRDQRRSLEGQALACLRKGDKRGHKRAMKKLQTYDALHGRTSQ